ncbi:MAG: hypothetical protein N2C12_10405, partial [Planctomycetales bacterium]
MLDSFDPYHQWLAIRPDDAPIDHYRLLGVDADESSPEVIANAAIQRTLLVRMFEEGEYALIAGRVLEEIAEAQACLSNPEYRKAYDEWLRVELARLAQQPQEAFMQDLDEQQIESAVDREAGRAQIFTNIDSGKKSKRRRKGSRRSSKSRGRQQDDFIPLGEDASSSQLEINASSAILVKTSSVIMGPAINTATQRPLTPDRFRSNSNLIIGTAIALGAVVLIYCFVRIVGIATGPTV